MDLLLSSFVILLIIIISDSIAKLFPNVPTTYFNILAGILIVFVPYTNNLVVPFESHAFMILFLAPLLFFEGQENPVLLVKQNLKTIFGVAGVLAILSAIIITYLLPQLFAIAMPVSFLIVAIAIPTDVTAFDSVIGNRIIDFKVRSILKMEALFNDATGIVILTAALAWEVTGSFSVRESSIYLLKSATGGVLIGATVAIILMFIRQKLARMNLNDLAALTALYIITPFIIYYISEELHVSGIIAVVVAGVIYNSEIERSKFTNPQQAYFKFQLVNFITHLLDGGVFVILGISLARIIREQHTSITESLNWLFIGLVVYLLGLLCRYIYYYLKFGKDSKEALVFALGGVHGTITLALAFSLIGEIDSELFNFILLVEIVVIISSMIIPTLAFKFLLPKDREASEILEQTDRLREKIAHIGLKRVRKMHLPPKVYSLVEYDLYDQMRKNGLQSFLGQWKKINSQQHVADSLQSSERKKALMLAFEAERRYLYELATKEKISKEVIHTLYSEILLAESLIMDPQYQQET